MKFYADRKRMLQAISNAVLLTKKNKNESPIVNNVLIDISEGYCLITSTNFEETLKENFPIDELDCSLPQICVPADKLKKVLSKGKADQVEIRTDPQNWFHVKIGKVTVKLPGNDYNLFPVLQPQPLPIKFTLSWKDFKEIYDKTLFSIGENESRNLMGLNIQQKGSDIMFQGADAYRITRYFIPAADDFEENIILPKTSLKTIAGIFKNEEIDFHFDEKTIVCCNKDLFFKCKGIECEYPNLDRLVERQSGQRQVIPSDLVDSLEMMQVLTDNDVNAISKVTLNCSTISIESQKTGFSDGEVEIDCKYGESTVAIGLNIKFFADIAKVFKKYDELDIYCEGPDKPVTFRSEECNRFVSVLMPVQIQW